MSAVVLLITLAVGLPGTHGLAFPAAQADHPAGCHSHGRAPSITAPVSPTPTSYQCCVNGHHAAIPSGLFSLRSVTAQFSSLHAAEGLRVDFAPRLHAAGSAEASGSPPVAASLRI